MNALNPPSPDFQACNFNVTISTPFYLSQNNKCQWQRQATALWFSSCRNHIIPYNYFELFIRFTQNVYQFCMTPLTSNESSIPVTSHAFLIFLNRWKCQPWYCNALRGNWWDDVIFLALVFGFQISSCLSLWVIVRKYWVCSGREKTHCIFLLRKI